MVVVLRSLKKGGADGGQMEARLVLSRLGRGKGPIPLGPYAGS